MSSVTRLSSFTGEMRAPVTVVVPMRPLEHADDGALVQAILDGSPRAATVFFDRFAPEVERHLRRLLGPDADVAVALNEVFFRALERLGELTAPEGVRRWLHSIAVFVAKEQRRARRQTSFLELRPWEFFRENVGPSVAASLEAREALQRVYEILDRLNEDDRALFILRFVDELALNEVAERSSTSLASVKRHLGRAQKKFCLVSRICG